MRIFKNFRNDVRYVGLAPERLFVTTYGTSVWRKRVNMLTLLIIILSVVVVVVSVTLLSLSSVSGEFY